jgi:hypothetical protein
MIDNKDIVKRITNHYNNKTLMIDITELTVLSSCNKLLKDKGYKSGTDKDVFVIVASLDKIGMSEVIKRRL